MVDAAEIRPCNFHEMELDDRILKSSIHERMTIILFLVDTSASMHQRAALGSRLISYIDLAKEAVEAFIKLRAKNPESRMDRYMLLTFENCPCNIKAGWKDNMPTFIRELHNLQCDGITTLRDALINAFALLNLNRMISSIDNYGLGRCPNLLEPAVILVITDGGKLTASRFEANLNLNLPMSLPIPGHDLTYEPFRWDQRVFSLVLRLPGAPIGICDTRIVPRDASPIDGFCTATGGRSYKIITYRMMMQCIESLVLKVQRGVVLNFERKENGPPTGQVGVLAADNRRMQLTRPPSKPILVPTGPNTWRASRAFLHVPQIPRDGKTNGFWPIPESFWPDPSKITLPRRSAQPVIQVSCTNEAPVVSLPANLPVDKYKVDPSHLTQFILSKKDPRARFQVFVSKSCKPSAPEIGCAFGYLESNINLTSVYLVVLPYNYPVLLPLLEQLFKKHHGKPTPEWGIRFQSYLRAMPCYYTSYLQKALVRMGLSEAMAVHLFPSSTFLDFPYNKSVLSYLKLVKFDCTTKLTEWSQLVEEQASKKSWALVTQQMPKLDPLQFQRSSLFDELIRLRNSFYHPTAGCLVNKHSVPCSQMSDYARHVSKQPPPLRDLEPSPLAQIKLFGNPFKRDKKMMVDEADVDLVGRTAALSPTKQQTVADLQHSPRHDQLLKRKRGPLPKDTSICRADRQTLHLSSAKILKPSVQCEGVNVLSVQDSQSAVIRLDKAAPNSRVVEPQSFTDDRPLNEITVNLTPGPLRNSALEVFMDTGVHLACSAATCYTKSELEPITKHNKSVMLLIRKEVRRPGKMYERLIELVKTFQGDTSMKVELIGDVIKELKRFKRLCLVEKVEAVLKDVKKSHC